MPAIPSASVRCDTHFQVGHVDRRIFGGFLEHLGRAVYEGVYDPGNPLSDAQGFRQDVLQALRGLAMPVMRYPGGNFVSAYDWTDGVGPRAQRPVRPDFAWKSVESNQFGTDEFMTWCQALGTTPMMAVNLGTAGPAEAARLLEYCNLPTGTAWADRRAANGHPAPYGVPLWCLGNEMDGPWQAGHVPAETYGQRANAASRLMKGLDGKIQTIACGSSGRGMATYMQWDRVVLEHCWDTVDYISAHRYSGNWSNNSDWFLAEGVEIERIIADYAGLLACVRGQKRSNKQVHLSFDEWNVWYRERSENGNWVQAPHLLEEVYNLEDALVCAQYLTAFIRRADVVKCACLAQIVNVIAPILTRREGLLLQSIYHPIALIAQAAQGVSLTPVVSSPTYAAGDRGEVPALDVAVTYDAARGEAAFVLVNRNRAAALPVSLTLADQQVTGVLAATTLNSTDLKAANTWDAPHTVKPIKLKTTLKDGALRLTLPAPGFAVVRVQVAKR